MIFLAPQLPHSEIDAALAAAPVVRSFAPDSGGKAEIISGTTITLPPQSDRFALWLRTGEAARVLAANPALSELVTIAIVGGDSGVAQLDDAAMPQSLPLQEGVVAGDLKGVIAGILERAGIDYSFSVAPTDLPAERPDTENVTASDLHPFTRDLSFYMWKDENGIKVDVGEEGELPTDFLDFISITIQITRETAIAHGLAPAAALPLTWGGASVPNNAPLHSAEGAMLGIFPANTTFILTFEDDAEVVNLVYAKVLGELRDYPRVRGVLDPRERSTFGLTGLMHVRRLSDPRLNCSIELSNHNEEDARLLEHLAALNGFGVIPNGGRSNAEGATWARANVCRFVRAHGYSGFIGWADVNALGATGKIVLSEAPEFVGEVAPYVPPSSGDYLLLPDGIDKLILADGDGALLLATA